MLDFDYCGRRARDERAIALASPCAKARAIHFELATLYDRRAQQPLCSLRILVVEDEYLIASEIEETLAGKGAEIVGPAGCVETADELLSATAVQAAVVDLRLGGEMAFDLLDRLADRRVPAVLVTGYDREAIPPAYRALQLIQKPICADALTEALVAPAGLRFDNLDLRAFDDLHSARDLNGAAFVNKKAAP